MITKQIIKDIVETKFMINDIGKEGRRLAVYRYVYFKLCKIFVIGSEGSHESISALVNKHHATVTHGLKHINKIINEDKNMRIVDTYKVCYDVLNEMRTSGDVVLKVIAEPDALTTLIELKEYYMCTVMSLEHEKNKAVTNLEKKIEVLTKNDFIKKILTLEAQEIEELEERFEVFFKVKKSLNERKNQKV